MVIEKKIVPMGGQNIDITSEIRKTAAESGIKEGMCTVTALSESTGAVVLPEKRKEILEDIRDDLERVLPPRTNYTGSCTPELSAARTKAALIESSKDFIIHEGEVLISGNVYLMQFSGTEESSYTIMCC